MDYNTCTATTLQFHSISSEMLYQIKSQKGSFSASSTKILKQQNIDSYTNLGYHEKKLFYDSTLSEILTSLLRYIKRYDYMPRGTAVN